MNVSILQSFQRWFYPHCRCHVQLVEWLFKIQPIPICTRWNNLALLHLCETNRWRWIVLPLVGRRIDQRRHGTVAFVLEKDDGRRVVPAVTFLVFVTLRRHPERKPKRKHNPINSYHKYNSIWMPSTYSHPGAASWPLMRFLSRRRSIFGSNPTPLSPDPQSESINQSKIYEISKSNESTLQ